MNHDELDHYIETQTTILRGEEATDELFHFGIKGMKWGVRRYQNADGSLTEAGKKRYGSMSSEKLRKTLKKQIRNKRKKMYGWSNQWMTLGIGEASKQHLDEYNAKKRAYYDSPEYKKWSKDVDAKFKKVDKLYESGKIDVNEYDQRYLKIAQHAKKTQPKKPYSDNSLYIVGKGYVDNNYIRQDGKKLSMAYLQDLGYNKQVSEEFVKKLLKNNYTLG